MNKWFNITVYAVFLIGIAILFQDNLDIILCCGLFGIINDKVDNFNYPEFCTLGIANDTRGGDSCGVFIDGEVEYGVDKFKYFESFFYTSKLLNNTEKCRIALGHCRKASVGAVNATTAQPVVIYNEEKTKVDFVVLHNGTIYNYEDLAKKYISGVNITGMTDSQVMARIFYAGHYEALSEYNGGAAFVIVDYREKEPKVMFFKGASKKDSVELTMTEERPLYFTITDTGLSFSSIYSFLCAQEPWYDTYAFKENSLIQYKDHKAFVIKEYDRSKCQQNKIWNYTKSVSRYNYGYEGGSDGKYGEDWFWIKTDEENLYVTYKGEAIDGAYYTNRYGKVAKNNFTGYYPVRRIWYFAGVPIASLPFYQLLQKVSKKSGYSPEMLNVLFPDMARFLSIDPCYYLDKKFYIATSPSTHMLFTGQHEDLFCKQERFSDGIKIGTLSTFVSGENHIMDTYEIPKLNLKEIEKRCITLTNSLVIE